MSALDATFTAAKRGSATPDRAVLLAHGAGADKDAAALVVLAEALRGVGIPSLRFNFPYRAAGRKAPDRQPALQGCLREAAGELARRTKLAPERIVVGGRSLGGRTASMCVADPDDPLPALGLLLLAYPLHPPGKPERSRVDHLPAVTVPTLFISGTRDGFGSEVELREAATLVSGPVTLEFLPTADHGYKPLRSSGLTVDDVLADMARCALGWIAGLSGRRSPRR